MRSIINRPWTQVRGIGDLGCWRDVTQRSGRTAWSEGFLWGGVIFRKTRHTTLEDFQMDVKSILESLERTDFIWELLTLTPIVGPEAIISNNLKWSSRFNAGRIAFYNGDYERAAQIFRELDEDIPSVSTT